MLSGPGTGAGRLSDPRGVAVAPSGDLVVVDAGNSRVEEFTPAGTFVRSFGSLGGGNGQLSGPSGVAVDSVGYVYVADTGNGRVEEFASSGVFVKTIGASGAGTDGLLLSPAGVAVAANGDVYVTDTGGQRIEVYGSNGSFVRKWGLPGGADPCVSSRTVVGPVLTLVVLTTHASTWGFATGHGVVVDNAATATAPAERINHPTAG